MAVTADFQSIETQSTLTFKVLTENPLDPLSNIQFSLPSEFDVSTVSAVSVKTLSADVMEPFSFCDGSSPRCVDWDAQQATLLVKQFNQEYMPQHTHIYIEVGKVRNPSLAGPTSTFTYVISDAQNNPVETVTQGVFFVTTAGGFQEIEIFVPPDRKTINEVDVPFTFRMKPENAFTASALIKITLPAQLYVDAPTVQVGASLAAMRDVPSAQTDVRFNRIILVAAGFSAATGGEFYLTVSGFVNPPTTELTDAFEVLIYQDSTELDVVVQSDTNSPGLKFQADPSYDLTMSAEMSELKTGEQQTRFVISGTLTGINQSIVKQA